MRHLPCPRPGLPPQEIDINKCTPNTRVALRNDSYTLHKILPTKVDPLVSLMKVEKVPDSTYDMIGGLDKQVREIKEVGRRSATAHASTSRRLRLLLWMEGSSQLGGGEGSGCGSSSVRRSRRGKTLSLMCLSPV